MSQDFLLYHKLRDKALQFIVPLCKGSSDELSYGRCLSVYGCALFPGVMTALAISLVPHWPQPWHHGCCTSLRSAQILLFYPPASRLLLFFLFMLSSPLALFPAFSWPQYVGLVLV